MGKKWEHERHYVSKDTFNTVVDVWDEPAEDILKKMGEKGWELCAVGDEDRVGNKMFYFKRLKEE